ncbi:MULTISPECIES: hypothetical protein [Enterobacteriaceae]|uniref:Uncharacterized protein n=1 Tax=Citrobacter amalonaticus Y19 TaxID=1261127 RepID=A0A0F6TV66_CITAM|nr:MULTISPECIES: hypothetical protein [Enterobacteriaceae]EHK4263064.1 hypothetical protein [Escherichia coli]AKE58902.1 hypothetical protein F384_09670 [Citrobacter amalonaticus Y19]MBA7948106.1 hypothetical protein [Citrobacter freundii]MBJ9534900.1 hypothetical protein [Citrobacter freundii]MCC4546705.1 hypothetical protein [Enterobacter hormaechei]
MYVIWIRLRSTLMAVGLLTGVAIIAGLTLRFTSPEMSLQNTLYQVRYGLLAWRLSLYISGIVIGFSLYRRLSVQSRAHLKRIAGWSLVLLAVNEVSNLLQQGNGA